LSEKHWQDSGNMRRFFLSFAEHHGFNPLVPDNWYNIMPEVILERKVFYFIIIKIIILMFFLIFI